MKLCDFCSNYVYHKCFVLGKRAKLANMRVKSCSKFVQHEPLSCEVLFADNTCSIGFSSPEHLKKGDRYKNIKIHKL